MSKTKSANESRSERRFDREVQEFARRKFSKRQQDELESDSLNDIDIGDDDDTEIATGIDVSRLRRMDDSQ